MGLTLFDKKNCVLIGVFSLAWVRISQADPGSSLLVDT